MEVSRVVRGVITRVPFSLFWLSNSWIFPQNLAMLTTSKGGPGKPAGLTTSQNQQTAPAISLSNHQRYHFGRLAQTIRSQPDAQLQVAARQPLQLDVVFKIDVVNRSERSFRGFETCSIIMRPSSDLA